LRDPQADRQVPNNAWETRAASAICASLLGRQCSARVNGGVQHLGDRPKELVRANRYPGGQRERLRLAVDQGQRRCRPQFDVHATTALDGAQQVLLTDMLGRFHHDLIPGAFGLVVDPTFQDGGAHCRQLGVISARDPKWSLWVTPIRQRDSAPWSRARAWRAGACSHRVTRCIADGSTTQMTSAVVDTSRSVTVSG
jgi:hypothetical protein